MGSTGKITAEIHKNLIMNGEESKVIYSRGKKNIEKDAVRICGSLAAKVNHLISRFSGFVYGGCEIQTHKIFEIIKKENPDIVHLQCINGYFVNVYKLIEFLKENEFPTVLTLHADFMFTANCGCAFECEKWKFGCGNCPKLYEMTESYFFDRTKESSERMKKAFEGFEKLMVFGVSNWLSDRAKESPVMKNLKIGTIYNGIDTNVFKENKDNKVREKLGIKKDEKMILWVTSGYTESKGKEYFHLLTEHLNEKEYKFVVAGTNAPGNYEGKINFIGKVKNQERLADIYSAADVVVCCSKQESFPTVFLESQCCGTPVVGFDVGGVSETIFKGMGETVPLGNMEKMKESVRYWSNRKHKISEEEKNNCRSFYSSKRMAYDYIYFYKKMLGL